MQLQRVRSDFQRLADAIQARCSTTGIGDDVRIPALRCDCHFDGVIGDLVSDNTPAKKIEFSLRTREIDESLRGRASEKEATLFWLYFRQGLTAKEVIDKLLADDRVRAAYLGEGAA